MNDPAAAASALASAVSDTPAPILNVDPDFHIPADDDRGNGYARAFRILFPKTA